MQLIQSYFLWIYIFALSMPVLAQNTRELKRERSQTVRKLVVLAYEVQQQKLTGQDVWARKFMEQLGGALLILQPKLPKPYLERLRTGLDVMTKATASPDSQAIVEASNRFLEEVDQIFKLDRAPAQTPDAQIGEVVYKARCQVCHGEDGNADTRTAAVLSLKPLSWKNQAVQQSLTPFIAFNIILSGIDQSPKPAFRNKLSSHEMWSVAFWMMRLTLPLKDRESVSAKNYDDFAKVFPKSISISDLSVVKNPDMMNKVWTKETPRLDLQNTLLYSRLRAPFDSFRER